MADDIDIEEHDVLDNPKLKNIFPDISHIKTEVIDYEEEENEYQEIFMDPNQKIKTEPVECEGRDISNIHRNVIILGSKPSTPQPYLNTSTSQNETSVNVETSLDCEYSHEVDDPEILPCTVVLEDWRVLLSNNPCYCSECQVLFPTVNAIDFHRMTAHSFLVAVSNNKAVKSTSKSSTDEHNPIKENLKRIELLCKHCNVYYPDEIALIKHKYSLIPHTCNVCKEVFSDEETLKSHQIIHSVEKELYILCTICSCVFKKEDSFIGHISLNHGNSRMGRVMAPFSQKCLHCNKSISLPKNYNAHIRFSHEDLFFMKQNCNKQGLFQCHLCKLTFPSAYSERVHRATEHPSNMKYFNTKARRAIECNKNAGKRIGPRLKKSDKNVDIKTLGPKTNLLKNKCDKNVDMTTLIPKSNLFKCNKCQIHFISCSVAIEHSRHCTLSKGDWKCQACRRSFKLDDRQIHIQQHTLTERFKVIVVAEEILPRILNRCGICNICFDERTFSKYHASGCRQSQSVECGVCHLLIHEFAVSKHLKYHRELSLTLNDFIISDYFTIDKSIKDESSASSSIATAPVKRKPHTPSYNTLYFCPNCRCYMSRNRKRDGHYTGECKRRSFKELCKLCGLQFTKKAILSHKMYHKMFQMKLTDITFLNILNGKKILPSFPEFQSCSICQVYFFSSMALKNHVCNTEEHKSCKQCNEKFSDLALKLHLPFHQYSNPVSEAKRSIAATGTKRYSEGNVTKRPSVMTGATTPMTEPVTKRPILDLIKKYESLVTIWNILYRCQTCDIVLDSYNSVVEHCQDHFCNMENYNVNISYCKKCKLKFIDKCYSRHEHLHLENNIDIESFIIIDYDFSVLLSDDWLKIFDRLSKDQVQQILSKSIYNEIRGVRMELLSDGTLGSIYKCSLCNHSVDVQSIVDHVRNRECESEVKHPCTVCDIGFRYKNSAIAHENKHQISDDSFRIVSFNEAKDAFINEALIKHTKADDLKFVRCQYCGKLINKTLYRNHAYKHTYNQKMMLLQDRPLKINEPALVRPTKVLKNNLKSHKNDQSHVRVHASSSFHFFICGNCDVAMSKWTINKHICSAENQKQKCPKCNLFFRSSNLWKHYRIHEKFPKLSRKTINVTYINNAGESDSKARTVNNATSEDNASVENDYSEDDTAQKLRFYECVFCQTCVYGRSAKNHACMSRRGRTQCEQCGISVHASHFKLHKSLHKRISFSRKNIKIIKFKGKHRFKGNKAAKAIQTNASEHKFSIKRYKKQIKSVDKFSSDTDTNSDFFIDHKFDYMRVYKCTSCNLFFTSRYNLLEHIVNCKDVCDFEEGIKCEICNLNFHPLNIKIHKAVQKCDRRNISLINICTLIFKDRDVYNNSNWLYYCKQCDFYSLNPMRHHFASQHKSVLRKIPCTTCGVKFASICYRKHLHLHHNELNVSFSNLHVEVLEDYTLEEAGYVPQTPENTSDITQPSENERNADEIVNIESKVGELFRCPTCNLHFLTKNSAFVHQFKQQHNVKAIPCTKCNLPFSLVSLRRHMKLHNIFNTYNVTDAIINEYYRRKWNLCSDVLNSSIEVRDEDTSNIVQTTSASSHTDLTNETKEPISSNSHTVLTDNINAPLSSESHTVPTNEIKQMGSNSNTVSTHVIKQTMGTNSNTDSTDEIKQTMGTNSNTVSTDEIKQTMGTNSNTVSTDGIRQTMILNPPTIPNVEIKLYKCSECDVYFLTAESCYDHTYNHAPLDPTEYIACKICDLQFLCESLGKHMKGHREKTFNMDVLVVDEYQPHDTNVKIDTYSAIDRLKSKLVSTTTHSDND